MADKALLEELQAEVVTLCADNLKLSKQAREQASLGEELDLLNTAKTEATEVTGTCKSSFGSNAVQHVY